MVGRDVGDYLPDCARQVIWIAEGDDTPIGFAHGEPGEVMRLFVDADHTGLGAGAGLMQRALEDALPDRTGKVRIEATLNAVPFYQKWGFETVGEGVFSGRDASLPPIDVMLLKKQF
jgi:GNAT superfamily N-acetyltransferase